MAAVSVIRSSVSWVVLFKNWAQLIMSFLPFVKNFTIHMSITWTTAGSANRSNLGVISSSHPALFRPLTFLDIDLSQIEMVEIVCVGCVKPRKSVYNGGLKGTSVFISELQAVTCSSLKQYCVLVTGNWMSLSTY